MSLEGAGLTALCISATRSRVMALGKMIAVRREMTLAE